MITGVQRLVSVDTTRDAIGLAPKSVSAPCVWGWVELDDGWPGKPAGVKAAGPAADHPATTSPQEGVVRAQAHPP